MGGKSYKYELIVGGAILILLLAFFYKQSVVSKQSSSGTKSAYLLEDIKESIELKALWGDKKMTKKIDTLKHGISPSKLKWSRKGKKLTASFSNISAKELNSLIKKVMNFGIEIQKLDIKKLGVSYTVELKCKW